MAANVSKDLLAGIELAVLGRRVESVASVDDTHDEIWPWSNSAQVNAGALLIFDSSLTKQNIADAGNSFLFAQLAADFQADRLAKPVEWQKYLVEVLGKIGWVVSDYSSDSLGPMTPPVDWGKVILDSFAGSSNEDLVKAGLAATGKLKLGSNALSIWDMNAVDATAGNFYVVPLQQATNDDLKAQLRGFVFESTREPKGFLSWDSYYEKVAAARLEIVLNESVYATIRQAIIDKLEGRQKFFIARVSM